jgi:hypothetical protein
MEYRMIAPSGALVISSQPLDDCYWTESMTAYVIFSWRKWGRAIRRDMRGAR